MYTYKHNTQIEEGDTILVESVYKIRSTYTDNFVSVTNKGMYGVNANKTTQQK